MSLHTMRNVPGARRPKKRVGCGESSGHGKTSGRGTKGQYSRSGHKYKGGFEGGQMTLIRRLPKRGFNNAVKVVFSPVNVADLAKFAAGTEVTPDALRAAGLIPANAQKVAILATGEIDRKLAVKAHKFSATAKAKIEAAGGSCEVVA